MLYTIYFILYYTVLYYNILQYSMRLPVPAVDGPLVPDAEGVGAL